MSLWARRFLMRAARSAAGVRRRWGICRPRLAGAASALQSPSAHLDMRKVDDKPAQKPVSCDYAIGPGVHVGHAGAPMAYPPANCATMPGPFNELLSYTVAESQRVIAVATSGQSRR